MQKSSRKTMLDAARSLQMMLVSALMNQIPSAEVIKIHNQNLTEFKKLIEYENKQPKPFELEDK